MSVASRLDRMSSINCEISYAIEHPRGVNLSKLRSFFSNLIPDPYLDGHYRFRRFSQFEIIDHQIHQLPHTHFLQSKNYNPLLGDVTREYEELEPSLVQFSDFQNLLLNFFDFCEQCSPSNTIGVHQIRITTTLFETGNPAPEGIHQDGVNWVGIFSVDRSHILGGESQLYTRPSDPPILQKILNPGELLVVNDQELFHYATSIQPSSKMEVGSRDIFVLTNPAMPSPE